jgi:hypothetical protein
MGLFESPHSNESGIKRAMKASKLPPAQSAFCLQRRRNNRRDVPRGGGIKVLDRVCGDVGISGGSGVSTTRPKNARLCTTAVMRIRCVARSATSCPYR